MRHFAALAALVTLVAGHGIIKDPAPRQPGAAFEAACGEQPFYQQSSDINGNVQGIMQVVGADFDASACNLWLCKGFQFGDNQDGVQSYALGQTIDFQVTIAAPHTGFANVSIVKTSSNSMIGEPLIEFSNYASNNGVDANNTAFSVTLPGSLGDDCTTAGDCVLQWYWDAPDIDQTYESCVDFTVSGSGGESPEPVEPTSASLEPTSTTLEPTSATLEPTTVPTTALSSFINATSIAEPTLTTAITPIVDATTTAPPTETTTSPEDDCSGDGDEDDDEDDEGDDEDNTDDDDCSGDEDDDEDTGDDEEDDDQCPADEDDGTDDDEDTSPGDVEDEEPEVDDPEELPPSAPAPIFTTLPETTAQPTTLSTVTRVVTVTAAPVTVTAQPSEGVACTA